MSVSHSHRRTRRRFNPNIQPVRAMVGRGTRKRLNVCTIAASRPERSPAGSAERLILFAKPSDSGASR